MAEKSARCDALRNVCMIVVLTEQPWSTASHKRQRRFIVDLLFPYANEKARSTSRGHLELSALRAIMWCFVSSVRQGSRGLLHQHHHHCVALTGQPRTHVAVQPSSVPPPLAPSSFFVCSQNLFSLDLDPQSPGWHTWVREVSEHNTTSPHICSIVCWCSSCRRSFALTSFARVRMFAFCSNVFVLSSAILKLFATVQLPHSI